MDLRLLVRPEEVERVRGLAKGASPRYWVRAALKFD